MEIQKTPATPGISPVSSSTDRPPQDFSKLPAGSALNAVVINKLDAGAYLLKLLDGSMIRAQCSNELLPGQALRLEVVKADAMPELKIAWPEQHPEPATPLIIQNALRQFLPKQANLADFAQALRHATDLGSTLDLTEATSPVSAAAQKLLDALPAKEILMTADGLKQGINNSGVFLEAKLAQQLPPQSDFKAHLLILANALQEAVLTPAQPLPQAVNKALDANHALLAKTEGAIAHVVLDQLASLPQNNETQTVWQLSIPFTNGAQADTLDLKITQDGKPKQAQAEANWSVVLELSPPGLGTLNCKISLIDGQINTCFWGDSVGGMTQIQDNLGLLAEQYAEASLTVGSLNVVDSGSMPQVSGRNPAMPPLLDDFA